MIAKGGMAEVYRARTTGLKGFEKEVCVKKILPHLTEDDSFVTMFINEAKLAATLNYANIVQVHDLCVSEAGEYFIVMEYVDGKDLSDVIRATQLAGREIPPEIAVHITREVCQGLAYAHSRTDRSGAPLNITHRDMSPHNVLVSYLGEVKIVDFGIAKASSIVSQTAVGILKGKYGYMSPEQARGQPVDARSDIFNTGIVLYEMLVGERCFAGSSDFSTLNLMRNAEVTPPTQINARVPKSLEAVVLKALSREKSDRPQTAQDLDKLLGNWARQESAVATKTDLASFLQGLFQQGSVRSSGAGTGVIEVQSVDNANNAKGVPPRRSTERAESLANRPVEAQPAVVANSVSSAKSVKEPKKQTKDAAEASPQPPPVAEPKKQPAQSKKKPRQSSAEALLSPAGTPGQRAKPAKPAAKNKQPVGRRHLRPGMAKSTPQPQHRTAFTLAGVMLVFALIGVGVGRLRARAASQESAFREMEVVNRKEPAPKLGLIVIDSEPRGLEVRLAGVRLLHKTPVAVERPRDSGKLPIELLNGDKVIHKGEVELKDAQPFAQYHFGAARKDKLTSAQERAQLHVVGPETARVRVNGRSVGRIRSGPFELTPDKTHEIEISVGKKKRSVRLKLVRGEERTLSLAL